MHYRILDSSGPFHGDPSEIAADMRRGLAAITEGTPYITASFLPYIEREAIIRFEARTKWCPTYLPDRLAEPDLWRRQWVNQALVAQSDMRRWDGVTQASIRVLTVAAQLREAMAEDANTELISALSMLLVCEFFCGGYMLEAEAAISAHADDKHKGAKGYKAGVGKGAVDYKEASRQCVHRASELWKLRPDMLIGAVADDLIDFLHRNRAKLPTMETFPKKATVKQWLKDAAKKGSLTIPQAAQQPGRPNKNAGST